jgi:hypothetical protein
VEATTRIELVYTVLQFANSCTGICRVVPNYLFQRLF